MVPGPALDRHVFCRVLEDRGNVTVDEEGCAARVCQGGGVGDCRQRVEGMRPHCEVHPANPLSCPLLPLPQQRGRVQPRRPFCHPLPRGAAAAGRRGGAAHLTMGQGGPSPTNCNITTADSPREVFMFQWKCDRSTVSKNRASGGVPRTKYYGEEAEAAAEALPGDRAAEPLLLLLP